MYSLRGDALELNLSGMRAAEPETDFDQIRGWMEDLKSENECMKDCWRTLEMDLETRVREEAR